MRFLLPSPSARSAGPATAGSPASPVASGPSVVAPCHASPPAGSQRARSRRAPAPWRGTALSLLLALAALPLRAATPLPVAELKRDAPVDFEREILPFLRDNCLACHNQTKAKGDLNLETPQFILKGGSSGPGLVPGKGAESLLFKSAAHLDDDLVMPPVGNKSNARDLNAAQLALLRLWIDQGGRGEVTQATKIQWAAMPTSWSPVLAVALSPDGQFAYASRANQIHVYRIPTRQLVARLEDPGAGPGVAHRDLVNALAVSPDGALLASAAYREAKLWRLAQPQPRPSTPDTAPAATDPVRAWKLEPSGKLQLAAARDLPALELDPGGPIIAIAVSPSGKLLAAALTNGSVRIWKTESKAELLADLRGDRVRDDSLTRAEHDLVIARADAEFHAAAAKKAEEEVKKTAEALTKSNERHAANRKDLDDKRAGLKTQSDTRDAATKEKAELASALEKSKQDLEAATKAADAAKAAGKESLRAATAARLAADQAARAKSDLERLTATLGDKSEEPAARSARDLAQLTARDAAAKGKASDEAAAAVERALEDVAARAFAAGQAKALADRALADIPARQKVVEERLAAAVKALGELESQIKKSEIAFGASEFDSGLSRTNADLATRSLAETRIVLAAAQTALPPLETTLAEARRLAGAAAASPVHSLAFSPDDRLLATLADDGRWNLWSTATGQSLDLGRDPSLRGAQLRFAAPDQLLLVQTNAAHALHLTTRWSLDRTLGTGDEKSPLLDRVNALAFSPDGTLLATGAGEPSRSGEIKLWNVADGTLARDLGFPHSDTVLALAFSPRGDLLLSGGADRFMRLHDPATGHILRNFEGHTHHVLAVAWRRDGRTVASGSADTVVKTWNRLTGDRLKNVDTFGKEVTGLVPLGISEQFLAVAGSGQVRVFKETGEQIRTLPAGNAFLQCAAVTPDGRLAAAGADDGTLRLWTVADGKLLAEFPAPDAAPKALPIGPSLSTR